MRSMISAVDTGTVQQSCFFFSIWKSQQFIRLSRLESFSHLVACLKMEALFGSRIHYFFQSVCIFTGNKCQGSYKINHLFPLIWVHWQAKIKQDKPHLTVHSHFATIEDISDCQRVMDCLQCSAGAMTGRLLPSSQVVFHHCTSIH